MNLFEYIKSQLPSIPNVSIMKDMGANDELIGYIRETPWNINLNVVESITSLSDDGEAEVWFIGDTGVEQNGTIQFQLSNVDETDHISELWINADNYQVFLNGEELPILIKPTSDIIVFADGETPETATKAVTIVNSSTVRPVAEYLDASTAPASVEVSVKAK